MSDTPYRWQGNLYHGHEIVPLLTELEPWKEWLAAGNQPTADPEADLDAIAAHFEIDRHDIEQVTRRGLPYPEANGEGFCSACLSWFN